MFHVTRIIMTTATTIIYSSTCVLCLLLVISREKYLEIESIVGRVIFVCLVLAPVLEVNINWIHDWLISYNWIVGPVLVLLSIIDLKLFFFLIRS